MKPQKVLTKSVTVPSNGFFINVGIAFIIISLFLGHFYEHPLISKYGLGEFADWLFSGGMTLIIIFTIMGVTLGLIREREWNNV